MPKKKLQVNLKSIKEDIDKKIKTLEGFQNKVSDADSANIDLRIKHLRNAIKEVRSACKNAKMTPGFSPD
jgi:hypothetical protein